MSRKTEYAPGTPSWTDLASPDVAASAAFYGALFGWKAQDLGPDAGGYTMLTLGGAQVAAVGPIQNPGQPTAWTCYFAVEDADKTTEIAQGNGGEVLLPPMDVMTAGRMAILRDPTGAVFALWQARDHKGAELVDEPGTFSWTDLGTRDVEAAKRFYTTVFGWGTHTSQMGPGEYTEFKLGDTSVAGLMPLPPGTPAEVPAYWMPYVRVTSPDDTVAQATGLGARVVVAPMDVANVRFAILADPQGAAFGVYLMRNQG